MRRTRSCHSSPRRWRSSAIAKERSRWRRRSRTLTTEILVDQVVDALTVADEEVGWMDFGGVKLMIGAYGVKPADSSVAHRELPKIARAVHEKGNVAARARTLSKIAHLLAKAGDFDAARKTAEIIPSLRRIDFRGPSDGFYDAIQTCDVRHDRPDSRDRRRSARGGRVVSHRGRSDHGDRVSGSEDDRPDRARATSYATWDRRHAALRGAYEAMALAKQRPEPSRSPA